MNQAAFVGKVSKNKLRDEMLPYLWLKLIHILSATVLFGTGIGSAFYMFMANRRKDIAGITTFTAPPI